MSERVHVVRTSAAPTPRGGYVQGTFGAPRLFTAGVGPLDPETGQVVGTTIEEQTGQVLRNLEAILRAAGFSREHVLKATVHLADLDRDFAGFDAVFREWFGDALPARTTVGSRLRGILVEIDLVAGQPEPLPALPRHPG